MRSEIGGGAATRSRRGQRPLRHPLALDFPVLSDRVRLRKIVVAAVVVTGPRRELGCWWIHGTWPC